MAAKQLKYMSLVLSSIVQVFVSGCGLIYDYPTSCEPVKSELTIVTDWRYARNASPESMVYSFFPTDGSDIWSFHFAGKTGGVVDLMYGHYSILAYNDDTSRIRYDNPDDYMNFSFYCRMGGLFDGLGGTLDNPIGPSVNDNGEMVEICPDKLWCYHIDVFRFGDIEAEKLSSDNGDISVITVYPRQITPAYHYIIEHIENLEGVAHMCCSLSGMASMLEPSTMYHGDRSVTLPLAATKKSESAVEGSFFSFGLPERLTNNELTFFIWLSDGKKLAYRFDVSDQIRNAPDSMNVEIRVGGINLPVADKPSTECGTDVSVDGWITEVIDIQS